MELDQEWSIIDGDYKGTSRRVALQEALEFKTFTHKTAVEIDKTSNGSFFQAITAKRHHLPPQTFHYLILSKQKLIQYVVDHLLRFSEKYIIEDHLTYKTHGVCPIPYFLLGVLKSHQYQSIHFKYSTNTYHRFSISNKKIHEYFKCRSKYEGS